MAVPMIEFFLHLDKYLGIMIQQLGIWIYLLLFIIVFFETGLVVMPFLPGDSLLFVAGTLAATGVLDVWVLIGTFLVAAVLGDAVNYWIGSFVGPRVFKHEDSRFFKKKNLIATEQFYEKHGPKTIVMARFLPILRTFAPFVAGVGAMKYGRFAFYNILGALVWVILFVLGGYYFGSIPLIKNNLTVVIIAIILLSFIPPIKTYFSNRRTAKPDLLH